MWPFEYTKHRPPVVVFHIDQNGLAKGAYFRGDADVLIIDERDPKNRVYRMGQETADDELRRKIGKHPLGRILTDIQEAERAPAPLIDVDWRSLRWPSWSWPSRASAAAIGRRLKAIREALPFKAKSRAGA